MTDETILELIRRALVDVAPDRAEEFATVPLGAEVAALELDSISVMEMVGVVEDELDITLPDEELGKVETLADLARLVRATA